MTRWLQQINKTLFQTKVHISNLIFTDVFPNVP